MKPKELRDMGIPPGESSKAATDALREALHAGASLVSIKEKLRAIIASPELYLNEPGYGNFATLLKRTFETMPRFVARERPAPWMSWGSGFEADALRQMRNACDLPVAVRGALMPDAHVGYGLPIGGVLATRDAVIPFAVGMDIACRMKLSVLDMPVKVLESDEARLAGALERETRFGVGARFRRRHEHAVMDRDWSVSPVTHRRKDAAWAQLGSSGGGNHFVEFGTLTLTEPELGLEPGVYPALLSHSGSRGTGAEVAKHYSNIAKRVHPELPRELSHLAWLELSGEEGQEYWNAMELMGHYAKANHELIHAFVARNLGVNVLAQVENHHNFAWLEEHDGERLVVHRKGATPAHEGVLGVIPGSMATPGYVVRGKGAPESLCSASHGAGRQLSRTAATARYTASDALEFLRKRHVRVLSAGVDEVPMAYKDIEEVMEAQRDLVTPIARFDPRLVKMAPSGRNSIKM